MGNVPPRGSSGNFGSEFHHPVVGRRSREAPASVQTAGSLTPDRSRERTTRIHSYSVEEQEVVAKYQTPSEASQKQTINEELGIQDVTTIDEAWYPPTESEVASAIESILDKPQPMDVDPTPAEHSYGLFQDDAPELLGTVRGSDSPVTAREDRVLNMPAGFSRAPGDSRLTTESSAGATGRKITGHTE